MSDKHNHDHYLDQHGYKLKAHSKSYYFYTKGKHSTKVYPDGKWSHFNGVSATHGSTADSLLSHLKKVHSSQHSEEGLTPLPEYVPRNSTNVSGTPSVFGPPVQTKPVKDDTTQHAEGERIAGRSSFLSHHRRSGPHPLLHKLLKKYGGTVHNPLGGFTLPKKAAEAFNQAASGAGFQHGYHYSLKG